MAYFNQQMKKEMAPEVKKVLAKYKMKGTLSVKHHSTVVLNLKSGLIDFGSNNRQVNVYWIKENYTGVAKDFLLEVLEVMNKGNHDNSDIMTDYFDVGWYVNINIGNWDKPYTTL